MTAEWSRYELDFRFLARTSREAMRHRHTYFIRVVDSDGRQGTGEAGLFVGLSHDDRPGFEDKLTEVCRAVGRYAENPAMLAEWPTIRMGLQSALTAAAGTETVLYPSAWTRGESTIGINGLVWMGSIEEMTRRVMEKVDAGFRCIKIKIGAQDFDSELRLIRLVRELAPKAELRLDANGAFSPSDALRRLDALARYDIHSVEQPVRQGQWAAMAEICRESPIDIALDEELIDLTEPDMRRRMIETVRPRYIILKPTLVGGFDVCDEWIGLARETDAGWWATSALETNIGLNAIAQWVALKGNEMPQGLGTGQIYSNNIPGPVYLEGSSLRFNPEVDWKMPQLEWNR